MNFIDKIAEYLSPKWAAERARYRNITALYEAAYSNRTRRTRYTDEGDANFSTEFANRKMVSMAREMAQNYDVIVGALDIYASKVIGKCLQTQPMVKSKSGQLHPINKEIKKWYSVWINKPEISGISGGKLQRMAIRTWIRDGELFTHFLEGHDHPHQTVIPLSIEMIETDQIPYNSKTLEQSTLVQGIELNRYNQPIAYHIERKNLEGNIKKTIIPASEISHTKLTERFGQIRGVTKLSSVFIRAENLQDYEYYEQIQAKAGASIGIQVVRDKDMPFDPNINGADDREINLKPGMIFDDLAPGERVEMVGMNRPNPQLEDYRAGQIRMLSCGLGVPASNLSQQYDASFSAQRQARSDYALILDMIADDFIFQFWHPIYERFVKTLILYGFIDLLDDIDITTITEAIHAIPTQQWIDPLKEMSARKIQIELGLDSRTNIIRQSGRIPEEVDAELAADKLKKAELGLVNNQKPVLPESQDDDDEDENSLEESGQ